MRLDTTNWHEYRYDEIFDIRKGFYNKKPEREDNGTIPFIGGTSLNNGVTEYYSLNNIEQTPKTSPTKGRACKNAPLNEKLFPEKAIVVTNDGSVGYAFYQKDEFTCSHSVNPLYRKDGGIITSNIAMFICTVIMQDRYRWDYGRKWRPERMAASLIKLPSKQLDDGTFVPDWEYMENFIKSLNYEPPKTAIEKKPLIIDAVDWHRYKIGGNNGLFDVVLSKGDIKLDESIAGNTPLVSAGENNNGVVGYISEEGDGKAQLFSGNTITVDMFCNAHYQKAPFYSVSHGRVNVLIPKFSMNPELALFIIALINKEKYRFSYGRALYSGVLKNIEIKLPSKQLDDGTFVPDWEYMENFIAQLPYSDCINA